MSFLNGLIEKCDTLFKKGMKVATKGIDIAGNRMANALINTIDKFDDPELVANRQKYEGTCDNINQVISKVRSKFENERMKKLSDMFKSDKDERNRPLTNIERGVIAETLKKARQLQTIDKSDPEQRQFDQSLDEAITNMNNTIKESKEREKKKAEKKKQNQK